MFYERPDLFEELENGKDIEELLFEMIDEELNDDVFDTDLLNWKRIEIKFDPFLMACNE